MEVSAKQTESPGGISAQAADDKPVPSAADHTLLSWLLFALSGSFLYMLVVERPRYGRFLKLDPASETLLFDRLILDWMLWSKSLAVIMLCTVVVGMVHARGWRKSAWLTFVGLSVVAYFLMYADLRVYETIGVHFTKLLRYLGQPAFADAAGGGTQGWSGPVFASFSVVALVVILASVACYKLTPKLLLLVGGLRREPLWRRIALYGGVVVIFSPYVVLEGGGHQLNQAANRLLAVAVVDMRPLYKGWIVPGKPGVQYEDGRMTAMNTELQSRYHQLNPAMTLVPGDDPDVVFDGGGKPNVVFIVLESFRFDVLHRDQMPRLKALARNGLVLDRHYSNSSRTETGLFAITYGRYTPIYRDAVRNMPRAQMIQTFRKSGYNTHFVSSHRPEWEGMENFLSAATVDHAVYFDGDDWPQRDRNNLAQVKRFLESEPDRPKWVFSFLMSTHFEYQYPPEYEKHLPVDRKVKWQFFVGNPKMEELYNRYKNSVLFSDDAICDVIESIDLSRNIVIITGDHGESFGEDDSFSHAMGLSDYQSRVPLIILGAGVQPGVVTDMTQHVDLLPSLLHLVTGEHVDIRHCHGRDIFNGEPAPNVVLLANGDLPSDNLIFIRGDQRLKVNIHSVTDEVQISGFQDSLEQPIDSTRFSQAELDDWLEHVTEQIYRLYR